MIAATEVVPDWMPDAIPLRSIFRRISSVMCLAGRQPDIQVSGVDATRMSGAFTGS